MSSTVKLEARRAKSVPKGVGTRGKYAKSAQDSEPWDVDGKRYIDFVAGIAVNNAGHRHPKLMAAVAMQCEAFTHSCFHVAPYESYIRLAERLNSLTPGDFEKKTMLVTTGAEAVENTTKIGSAIKARLTTVSDRQGMEAIGDVGGLGAMIGYCCTVRRTRVDHSAMWHPIAYYPP